MTCAALKSRQQQKEKNFSPVNSDQYTENQLTVEVWGFKEKEREGCSEIQLF